MEQEFYEKDSLMKTTLAKIENGETGRHLVPHSKEIKVTEIAQLLEEFKNGYLYFDDDLKNNITNGDKNYLSLLDEADNYVKKNNLKK